MAGAQLIPADRVQGATPEVRVTTEVRGEGIVPDSGGRGATPEAEGDLSSALDLAATAMARAAEGDPEAPAYIALDLDLSAFEEPEPAELEPKLQPIPFALLPSPNVPIGQVTHVDTAGGFCVVWLDSRRIVLREPSFSRGFTLEPTAILRPTEQRAGNALTLTIAWGQPQPGDEVVFPGPERASWMEARLNEVAVAAGR